MIAIGADRFRSRAAASPESGAGSGGHVDDLSKRLGEVEKAVVAVSTKLDTALPQLATKADLHSLRSDMNDKFGSLRSDMSAMETRILKWMVGTVISGMAVAVAMAVAIVQILSHFH